MHGPYLEMPGRYLVFQDTGIFALSPSLQQVHPVDSAAGLIYCSTIFFWFLYLESFKVLIVAFRELQILK